MISPERLRSLKDNGLIDIVKNYRQYGYDESTRQNALVILESRGISVDDLKLSGNFTNVEYESVKDIYNKYKSTTNLTLFFYTGIFIFRLLGNFRMPEYVGIALGIIWLIAFILFFVYLIKSFILHNDFYKKIGKNLSNAEQVAFFLLGMPFYVIMFFYYRNLMKDEMKIIQ